MQKRVDKYLILTLIATGLALILFIAFTILVMMKYNFKMDTFNILIVENRTNSLTNFFKIFTYLGSFYTLLILTLISVILITFFKKDKKLALFYLICFLTICLMNLLLKNFVRRPRPEHLMIIEESGYSFPSGHAMMTFGFFALAIHYVITNTKNKILKIALTIIFSIIIILIGFSRIYLGVHYLSDVISGFLATFVIVSISLIIYNSNLFRLKGSKR